MSLFSTNDLCLDFNLTMWESKMPALAEKMNVYAGKRSLAKNFIAKQLLKRGIDPDTVLDLSQLT